jgi:hypothetical protein
MQRKFMQKSGSKKICALLLLFFVCSFFAFAFDWPVREGRLSANFGSNNGGIPLLGNFFEASGSIFPVNLGELVFVHDPENPAARIPSPLGSWMAIDHGDNILGIYGRYENRKFTPIPALVETATVLAAAGKSGWTEREGVYFAIYDRRERRWVNPSVMIPGIDDTVPPVIRQVELRNTAGTPINPALVQHIPQGLYRIYVDAADTLQANGNLLAPNRIICSVNGAEIGTLSFETIMSKNGQWMVYRNGLVEASQIYDEKGFGLGEIRFTRGQAVLVIEVRDIADNVRSATYRLTVD